MTTFIRIHRFYRSRLDEQFFNSIKRSTSHALLKRRRCAEEKVFFSAQEREGKQRSHRFMQYHGMRIFAFISMFLNYSWKSNHFSLLCLIYLPIAFYQCLFTPYNEETKRVGRGELKKVTVGHETRFRI